MDLRINGRGALIYGALGGIGSAVSKTLVKEGLSRITLAVRRVEDGKAFAAELEQLGDVTTHVVHCDLLDSEFATKTISEAEEVNGPVDILIQAAGDGPDGNLWELTDEDWIEDFEIKLLGAARVMREAGPRMAERGWGRIIVISGASGRAPREEKSAGGAVNSGLVNLVRSTSKVLGDRGVTINSIDPNHVRTPRWDRRIAARVEETGKSEEEVIAEIRKNAPLKKMVDPQQVADLMAFLASDLAGSINGTTTPVDGGAAPTLF